MYSTSLGQSPALAGLTITVVASGSMEPTIPTGSLVITKEAESYSVGDIVLYKSLTDNRYILHRIVDTDLDSFILQGDANPSPDILPVSQSQIVGRVIFYNHLIGTLRIALATPLGTIAVASICYFLFSVGLHKLEEVSDESYSKIVNRRW